MKNKSPIVLGSQAMVVRFEFTDLTATTVCVAGTFNDWHASTRPMQSSGDGHWLREAILEPGTYEYCLVVDGQWIPDPLALCDVPNPFGGRNSILRVLDPTEEKEHRVDQSCTSHPLPQVAGPHSTLTGVSLTANVITDTDRRTQKKKIYVTKH